MSSSHLNDQPSGEAAADRAQVEIALAPSRALTELAAAMQKQEYLVKFQELGKAIQLSPSFVSIADIAKAMQPPVQMTALFQTMAAIQQETRLHTELLIPPLILEDVRKRIAQMRILSESITAPHLAFIEMMRSQASVFDGISARFAALQDIKLSIPQFSQAALAWNLASIGLANRMNGIGLLAQREMLSARLFEVPGTYAKFVQHTTERLASNPSPEDAIRLRGSLNLAENQLLEITDAVSTFVSVPEDCEKPDRIRALNAPFAQQDELLSYEFAEDEDDLVAL
ncbi:MAG: hypothetical protein NTX50_10525, partial [Candidatus Sumerlaeota bacterium]|nr:hypothetical protein [Candidatus Sumerlaeota bacterium]